MSSSSRPPAALLPATLGWLRQHRRAAFSALAGTVAVGLLVGLAVTSDGYVSEKPELHDSSVWVANSAAGLIGRTNTAVRELNTVVETESVAPVLHQDATGIWVHDPGTGTLSTIDPATAQVTGSAPLPVGTDTVWLSEGIAVLHDSVTGELWSTPVTGIEDFDIAADPVLELGAGSVTAVAGGRLAAYSPQLGEVYLADPEDPVSRSSSALELGEEGDEYQLRLLGSSWFVLDVQERRLATPAGIIDLGDLLPAGAQPVLQQSSETSAQEILLAYTGGLLAIPLDGAEPQLLVDEVAGTPAAPTALDGCRYAAWSDGALWRDCAGAAPERLALAGMPAEAEPVFLANGARLVLNDPQGGAVWTVQSAGELVDNWADLVEEDPEETEQLELSTELQPEYDRRQQPPVAVDDEFGARPGRTTVLPVLLNDYDVNGDPLMITGVTGLDPVRGTVQLIDEAQRLQLTLPEDASGEFRFRYTIDDGRGGSAEAEVLVQVRAESENSPPVQVQNGRGLLTASGEQVSGDVLTDWVDPDGDPIYLAGASTAAPDTVSFRSAGELVFFDSGSGLGAKQVAVLVSDGRAQGVGSLAVTVRAAGDVPIITEPFALLAYEDEPIVIEPLEHVRGGTGRLRLQSVADSAGLAVEADYPQDRITVTATTAGTHLLDYAVSDGTASASGQIRLQVRPRPAAGLAPVPVPITVFVPQQSSETVDALAGGIDPAGGVLVLTGLVGEPSDPLVRAEVLEQSLLRITLAGPLEAPAQIRYTVSNGLAQAEGVVTVIEIPRPTRYQAPVPGDDSATVRAGGVVEIPVLANDVQPDGGELSLDPRLPEELPEGSGLAMVSGDTLRFLAPETVGTVAVRYRVNGPGGQWATGVASITVTEADPVSNAAPRAETVTARVFAGEQVRIPIPLSGIDPDGDAVTLIGPENAPAKGSIVDSGIDYLVYEAGAYVSGTDSFRYTVVDALGARSTGTVRLGIAERPEGTRDPVATADAVVVRPGRTVTVDVLANDSDPESDGLSVDEDALEVSDERIIAEVVDNRLRITVPQEEGDYSVLYSISNTRGGSASAFVTLEVTAEAPLNAPVLVDQELGLLDILDREQVTVPLLRGAFFADGDLADLELSLLPGYDQGVELLDGQRLRAPVGQSSRIIPFRATHPEDPAISSIALVWLPGLEDALPQLDRTAPPITVVSQQSIQIDLDDYVLSAGDDGVRITDRSTVTATNSDGSALVVDDDTVRFASANNYSGPASLTVEVTDGVDAADPEGRIAVIVLPITVTPSENQPPVFHGSSLSLEPGQSRTIDLLRLTAYPYPDDLEDLRYALAAAVPEGFTARLEGTELVVTAMTSTPKGTTAVLPIGVEDALTIGESGVLRLEVVASTRPLALPIADRAVTPRGATTRVDVLANDQSTNPFPGDPLRVVQVRGLEGGNLPEGVQITPSADRSRLDVTVASSAAAQDVTLQYQVADVTEDPDRLAWGVVTLSIQDAPSQPSAPVRNTASGFIPGQLTLTIAAPAANNAPITGYRIVAPGGYRHECGLSTVCTLNDLVPGQNYQFSVVATNAIGDSSPGVASVSLSADYLPAAPGTVSAVSTPPAAAPGGRSITASWSTVPDPALGSPLKEYLVTVEGIGSRVVPRGTTSAVFDAHEFPALQNNRSYTVIVSPRNSAQVVTAGDWASRSTSVTTIGPPSGAGGPTATLDPSGDGSVIVRWSAGGANGAGSVSYSVGRFDGTASAPFCWGGSLGGTKPGQISPGGVTGGEYRDATAVDGQSYTYVVYADNGWYCTARSTGAVQSLRTPGAASMSVAVVAREDGAGVATGQHDIRILSTSVPEGSVAERYQYRLGSDPVWRAVPAEGWVTSLENASVYGQQLTLEVRGCRPGSDSLCGPASAPSATLIAMNTRVSITSCVVGQAPLISLPANGAATRTALVSYLVNEEWSEFVAAGDPVPAGATDLRAKGRVTIAGIERIDPHYAQAACGSGG